MNKLLAIIPSRYESTRFPGKPLALINGKEMIMWVYDAVEKSNIFSQVYVATDNEKIFNLVQSKGAKAIMTSKDLSCGTERCNQALSILEDKGERFDIVINIQGDEPLINKEQIEKVVEGFEQKNSQIVTLVKAIDKKEDVIDSNVVKVVCSNKRAIYFSRSVIPFNREKTIEELIKDKRYYKHIGIYGYRTEVLHEITKLKESNLEQIEKLEQLRWLENGYNIIVNETNIDTIGVDTPQDLENINKIIK